MNKLNEEAEDDHTGDETEQRLHSGNPVPTQQRGEGERVTAEEREREAAHRRGPTRN